MITVELVHVVLHKRRVEGKSIRKIAEETGLHRKTVRRYLRGAEPNERKAVERARPVRDAVTKRVTDLVEDSKRWTEGKQVLTASRVLDMLREGEDGHNKLDVGYTVV